MTVYFKTDAKLLFSLYFCAIRQSEYLQSQAQDHFKWAYKT